MKFAARTSTSSFVRKGGITKQGEKVALHNSITQLVIINIYTSKVALQDGIQ